MGRWGWAPLLPLHGHVKVAFYRETPEGAMRGGWHSSRDNRGGRLCMRERCSDELTAPERAGIGRKKDDKHHFGYQSRNMFKAAAGIRPSEGMRERLEGGFLLMPHRDNTKSLTPNFHTCTAQKKPNTCTHFVLSHSLSRNPVSSACSLSTDSRDLRLPAQRGGDSVPNELWRVSEEDAHQHRRTGLQRYQTQHRSTCPSPSPSPISR